MIILKLQMLNDMKNMIRHILVEMIILKKLKDTKNTNDDGEYKEGTSKLQDDNESVINTTK